MVTPLGTRRSDQSVSTAWHIADRRVIRSMSLTPGVETTTGPLGSGCSPMRWVWLFAEASAGRRPSIAKGFDHHRPSIRTFSSAMAVSWRACLSRSLLTGRYSQGWGSSSCCYDDNGISIDGDVRGLVYETIPPSALFRAYGWHVESKPSTATIPMLRLRSGPGPVHCAVDERPSTAVLQDE